MNNLLLADMSNATVWGTFLIVVLVIFLVIFFAIIAKFFKTWLRARLAILLCIRENPDPPLCPDSLKIVAMQQM